MTSSKCALIIPALNEEKSISQVLQRIPERFQKSIIVVDNGSTDQTSEIAIKMGAIVINENKRGYGQACLAGLLYCEKIQPDYVAFIDADFSDEPSDLEKIYLHMIQHNLDFVVGSRTLGLAERGSLLPQARLGNWFAGWVMNLRYGYQYSDLGPLRIIRWESLKQLQMQDRNFGWTIEMQIKALQNKIKVGELPVHYKKRIGISKITGTVKGTLLASCKILFVLFKYIIFKK